jgi:D-glycero-D-manno-heptose 1,7-bisphosphate phosphatase
MNKAVFLDRDGIINEEIGKYVWSLDEFIIVDGIIPLLQQLKANGYFLIVVTNQAGIAKGLYTHEDVASLHAYFQESSGHLIDHFYYAPYHPDYSESLGRKPGTLLFEKGIAKYQLDPMSCWMIGDKERDMIPAKKLGMHTIRLFIEGFYEEGEVSIADHSIYDIQEVEKIILS